MDAINYKEDNLTLPFFPKSKDVLIFPCSNRAETYDPAASVINEYNLTRCGSGQTYILSKTEVKEEDKTEWYDVELFIDGYYFNIKNIPASLFANGYEFAIATASELLDLSTGAGATEDTVSETVNIESNNTIWSPYVLVQFDYNDESSVVKIDSLDSTNTYYICKAIAIINTTEPVTIADSSSSSRKIKYKRLPLNSPVVEPYPKHINNTTPHVSREERNLWNNAIQSVEKGTENGTIKITRDKVDSEPKVEEVEVAGLKGAAYEEVEFFEQKIQAAADGVKTDVFGIAPEDLEEGDELPTLLGLKKEIADLKTHVGDLPEGTDPATTTVVNFLINKVDNISADQLDPHLEATNMHVSDKDRKNWDNALEDIKDIKTSQDNLTKSSHSHNNKLVLDELTQDLVDSWNAAEEAISGIETDIEALQSDLTNHNHEDIYAIKNHEHDYSTIYASKGVEDTVSTLNGDESVIGSVREQIKLCKEDLIGTEEDNSEVDTIFGLKKKISELNTYISDESSFSLSEALDLILAQLKHLKTTVDSGAGGGTCSLEYNTLANARELQATCSSCASTGKIKLDCGESVTYGEAFLDTDSFQTTNSEDFKTQLNRYFKAKLSATAILRKVLDAQKNDISIDIFDSESCLEGSKVNDGDALPAEMWIKISHSAWKDLEEPPTEAYFIIHLINNFRVISFNSNGGTIIDPIVATVGENISDSEPDTPEKAGYDFGGWYTDEAFSTAYDFDSMPMPDISTELFAKWDIKTYVITYSPSAEGIPYNFSDEEDVPREFTVESNYPIALPTTVIVDSNYENYENYKFIGWFTEKDYLTQRSEIGADTFTDITLYPKFELIEAPNDGTEEDGAAGETV